MHTLPKCLPEGVAQKEHGQVGQALDSHLSASLPVLALSQVLLGFLLRPETPLLPKKQG